jgi:hypothetical protein
MSWRSLVIGISIACILVGGIISLCCYFAGYLPNTEKNLSLRPVSSYIAFHTYEPVTCSYTCNCIQVCTTNNNGRTSCSTICQTCYYTCYDHYLTFDYQGNPSVVKNTSPQTSQIYMGNTDYAVWTNQYYQVGTNVTTYYNICPLEPILESDINTCNSHGSMPPLLLNYYVSTALLNTSIAFLVFVCIGVLGLLIIGCHFVITSGIIVNCCSAIDGFVQSTCCRCCNYDTQPTLPNYVSNYPSQTNYPPQTNYPVQMNYPMATYPVVYEESNCQPPPYNPYGDSGLYTSS